MSAETDFDAVPDRIIIKIVKAKKRMNGMINGDGNDLMIRSSPACSSCP